MTDPVAPIDSAAAPPAPPIFARQTALLMALAVIGAALEIPLGLGLKSLFHFDLGYRAVRLGAFAALVCSIPLALRLGPRLGLPGAPLIAAHLAGQRPPWRLRDLVRIAILYDIAAIVVAVTALAVLVLSGAMHVPAGSRSALPLAPTGAMAGRLALFGALASIGAGLSEEILFRLCLFAILAWLLRPVMHDSTGRPSRAALWCATLAQGYAFGLVHLVAGAPALLHMKTAMLITGLVVPQTWQGVVFGRLYLRRGLEAAMLAHGLMDLTLLLFAALTLHATRS